MCDNKCCNTIVVGISILEDQSRHAITHIQSQRVVNRNGIIASVVKNARTVHEERRFVRWGLAKKKTDADWDAYRKELFAKTSFANTDNNYRLVYDLCCDIQTAVSAGVGEVTLDISDYSAIKYWADTETFSMTPDMNIVDMFYLCRWDIW